jgi:DNA-binding response OmpR family regulator
MANALALVLAEQEPETRGFLERHLADDGFEVLRAERGREALELAEQVKPDLVLVGSSLPDGSGAEVCRRLREGEPGRSWDRDVPVILLGRDGTDVVDRVRAFRRGCDDYVSYPLHYEELVARIRAVLRRSTPQQVERMEVRDLVVDRRTRRVTVGGEAIALAGREYDLLVALAADSARVFTKEELLRDVWGFRSLGRTRTLDSHASRLRRKLNAPTGGDFVVNVWGVGYKLVDDLELD